VIGLLGSKTQQYSSASEATGWYTQLLSLDSVVRLLECIIRSLRSRYCTHRSPLNLNPLCILLRLTATWLWRMPKNNDQRS